MRLVVLIIVSFSIYANMVHAQQKLSDGTDGGQIVANTDAILELASKNKGLLHARVELERTTLPTPLSAHVAGMMVFNTIPKNDVVVGIYYNDGSKWVLASGSADANASQVNYDNAASGLQSNSVQEAIDEIWSKLDVEKTNIVETGVDYTAKMNDAVILGDASSGHVTITLPPATGNKGKKYTIKKEDTNEDGYVNVIGNIIGVPTGNLYTALPYSGWDLVSDGARWRIINKF